MVMAVHPSAIESNRRDTRAAPFSLSLSFPYRKMEKNRGTKQITNIFCKIAAFLSFFDGMVRSAFHVQAFQVKILARNRKPLLRLKDPIHKSSENNRNCASL